MIPLPLQELSHLSGATGLEVILMVVVTGRVPIPNLELSHVAAIKLCLEALCESKPDRISRARATFKATSAQTGQEL